MGRYYRRGFCAKYPDVFSSFFLSQVLFPAFPDFVLLEWHYLCEAFLIFCLFSCLLNSPHVGNIFSLFALFFFFFSRGLKIRTKAYLVFVKNDTETIIKDAAVESAVWPPYTIVLQHFTITDKTLKTTQPLGTNFPRRIFPNLLYKYGDTHNEKLRRWGRLCRDISIDAPLGVCTPSRCRAKNEIMVQIAPRGVCCVLYCVWYGKLQYYHVCEGPMNSWRFFSRNAVVSTVSLQTAKIKNKKIRPWLRVILLFFYTVFYSIHSFVHTGTWNLSQF